MKQISRTKRTRAVVVGSGIAGLSTALGIGHCTVLTRGTLGSGSSRLAQGGIAAALDANDRPAAHAADTLAVSGGIGDPLIARAVTDSAAGCIDWLQSLGARFDANGLSSLSLGQEAGHSARRIVHAEGDATGAEVMRVLTAAVSANPGIEICEQHELIDLIRHNGRVVGVLALDLAGEMTAVLAPAVILATGGIGGLYLRTTNPREVAGDGLAIAARAGARLADLEYVQFHPTALDVDVDVGPMPLLTEALRGEGAVLTNHRGDGFMAMAHPDADLAPRDVVTRAIWQERSQGRDVYLDATKAVGNAFPKRFPTAWTHAMKAGIDPRSERMPIIPAQHYHMGGIATDTSGRTSLPGLWAVGEVAATGLHGANRLASNSLLEAMVFAAAVSCSVIKTAVPATPLGQLEATAATFELSTSKDGAAELASADGVRRLMWKYVGPQRDADGLRLAVTKLAELKRRTRSLSARNLALIGQLIATAALQRKESRGAHWRSDYPEIDPTLASRTFVTQPTARTIELAIGGELPGQGPNIFSRDFDRVAWPKEPLSPNIDGLKS